MAKRCALNTLDNSVIWLRESIRRIFFRIHLTMLILDTLSKFAILTDKGLADTEMFAQRD